MLPGVHEVMLSHPTRSCSLTATAGSRRPTSPTTTRGWRTVMLPHVSDRPLSLQVFPGGIGSAGTSSSRSRATSPTGSSARSCRRTAARSPGRRRPGRRCGCSPSTTRSRRTRRPPGRSPGRPDRFVVDFDRPARTTGARSSPARAARARDYAAAGLEAVRDDHRLARRARRRPARGASSTTPTCTGWPGAGRGARRRGARRAHDEFTRTSARAGSSSTCCATAGRTPRSCPWAVRAKAGAPVAMPLREDELRRTSARAPGRSATSRSACARGTRGRVQ